jgi:hypothetical protein
MLLERWDGSLAVTGVALVIAVGEPRCKFSQVALPDWLTAQRTERLRAGCPAIHQDEFHMPPPRSVSCAWTRVASRQQRKLQMRSLQRKFIVGLLVWKGSAYTRCRERLRERARLAETHRQSDPSPKTRARGGRPDQRPSVADRACRRSVAVRPE